MEKDNRIDYQRIIKNDLKAGKFNHIRIMMILIVVAVLVTLVIMATVITKTIETNAAENQALLEEQQRQEEIARQEEQRRQEEIAKQEELKRLEEERKAKFPQLTEVGRQNMENIYHSETKRAFLTFDDGPSTVTPQILDTLKNENIKATFFMLGTSVENFPETAKRVWDEGHYVANHGYSHVYSSIYSSTQAVFDEYVRCEEAIRNALGEPEYCSHLFRFPGGIPGGKYEHLKREAKQVLEDNNILSIDWNALTGDAETQHPVAEKLMAELQETTQDKNSVVILMHDAQAKKVTADMLPDIIAYLRGEGYEFKTFYDIIK